MNRLVIPVVLALTIGISGGLAWLLRSGMERPVPTAETLRARP